MFIFDPSVLIFLWFFRKATAIEIQCKNKEQKNIETFFKIQLWIRPWVFPFSDFTGASLTEAQPLQSCLRKDSDLDFNTLSYFEIQKHLKWLRHSLHFRIIIHAFCIPPRIVYVEHSLRLACCSAIFFVRNNKSSSWCSLLCPPPLVQGLCKSEQIQLQWWWRNAWNLSDLFPKNISPWHGQWARKLSFPL